MRWNLDLGKLVFNFIVFSIIFIIIAPIFLIIVISFSSSGFRLPPSGLTLQWYIRALTYTGFRSGLYVSFLLALISSGISTIIGIITSFALIRCNFKGRDLISILFMSPLMIPVVIAGLALYIFLVRLGVSGGMLALVIGHTILITPYSIRIVSASLQIFDRSLEEAAMNVGAGSMKTFFWITLPIIKTGIISGMMTCFIVSWNNFALSIFLSGPGTYPLPIQLYSYLKFEWSPTAAALATFIIFLSGLTIVVIDRVIGLSVVMGVQNENI